MNIVSSNQVINNFILVNMITYFVLSHFKVIFKKEKEKNFQTFKEKLQKIVTKMRHVIIPIQPDLPGPQLKGLQ